MTIMTLVNIKTKQIYIVQYLLVLAIYKITSQLYLFSIQFVPPIPGVGLSNNDKEYLEHIVSSKVSDHYLQVDDAAGLDELTDQLVRGLCNGQYKPTTTSMSFYKIIVSI